MSEDYNRYQLQPLRLLFWKISLNPASIYCWNFLSNPRLLPKHGTHAHNISTLKLQHKIMVGDLNEQL